MILSRKAALKIFYVKEDKGKDRLIIKIIDYLNSINNISKRILAGVIFLLLDVFLYMVFKNYIFSIFISICIFLVFSEIVYFLKNKKKDMLNCQLMEFLSNSIIMLRAGRSIRNIIKEYGLWAREPLKSYLKILTDELEINIPFDEAVDNFAAKCSSSESLILSTALKLNNKIGGDIIFIIEKIIETLSENRKQVSNAKMLTLQSRYSGYIISFLPVAILVMMFIFMNSSITRFFSGGAGNVCLIIGCLLETTGIVIIRKVLILND
jgi:tight adherence protein B